MYINISQELILNIESYSTMKSQLIILTLTLAVVLSAPTKEENPLRSVEDESVEDPWSSIESEEIKTGSKGKNVVSDIKNLVVQYHVLN